MKKRQPKEITLNLVLISEKESGYYSAFFAEIPEAIAYGKDQTDVIERLVNLAKYALEERKEESLKSYLADMKDSLANDINYTIRPYKLVHA